MDAEPSEFDMAAAWLRRAGTDMQAYIEALAARLEPALPGRVAVERRRDGLFSKLSHVVRVTVQFDDAALIIAIDHGYLRARRTKVVRGVTLSSEDVTVPAWLEEVVRRARILGEGAGAADTALHDFLVS